MRAKGFTLIELLVVIAIIGILASIVLVSLSSARNKGRDTRIASDVRQIRIQIEAEVAISGAYIAGASSCVTATDTLSAVTGNNCKTLSDDIVNNGGAINLKATVASNSFTAYALYGRLPSDATKYFCMDSTGKTNSVASANTTVACP